MLSGGSKPNEDGIDNPGRKLKSAKEYLQKLSDVDISKYQKDGYEVQLSGLESANAKIDEIADGLKEKWADSVEGLSDSEIRDLATLYWAEISGIDSKNPEELFESAINKGLVYRNPNAAVVRNVEVPLSRVGSLGSAEDIDNYGIPYRLQVDQMFEGIKQLNEVFESGKMSMPSNLDLDAHTWRLAGDSEAFVNLAKSLGTKRSAKSLRERVLGMNMIRPKSGKDIPAEMSREDAMQLNVRDFTSNLVFHLPLIAKEKPSFDTNEPLETLTHEFGHSIARAIDFGFGFSFARPEVRSAYRGVNQDFVSEYGSTDSNEHFAEAFSSYVSTGKAPESWISFMRQMGIIN